MPSGCLSVSQSANRPPTYTKEAISLVTTGYPALSTQIGTGTLDSSGLNSQGRKIVDLLFTKISDTCCFSQGRVGTLLTPFPPR